jgi:CelD/BcsL family acetyltransferase involved in cellulose biosynthesis
VTSVDSSPQTLATPPTKSHSSHWVDQPGGPFTVEWIDNIERLQEIVPQWKRLAQCTLCPNVFYEPQLLIPAWKHIRGAGDVLRVVAVWGRQRNAKRPIPVLCGLFPLRLSAGPSWLPWRCAELWQHIHCFLNTPLIRSDASDETLTAWFDCLQQRRGTRLVNLNNVPGDGPLHHAMINALQTDRWKYLVKKVSGRALYVRRESSDQFMEQWPRKRRQEINRLERRLGERGKIAVDEFQIGDDAASWGAQFIQLEACGWKGTDGTAISNNPSHARFLTEAMIALAEENRLMALTLRVDGEPVAMKINFLTHRGGFAFKIAYHPAWARYSPGTILEKINVIKLHQHPTIDWMDSCAAANHPMINPLWPDRRLIQSWAISMGGASADAALSLIPAGRLLRNHLPGRRFKGETSLALPTVTPASSPSQLTQPANWSS